jgi:hypothetical protein
MLRPAYTPEQENGIQIQRFADDYFDLILEQGPDGKIRAFHLCYNLLTDEHALAWTKKGPLRHMKVDQGEDKATINRAPILVADGACPIEALTQEFKKRGGNLPPEIQALILSKIRAACD